MDLADRNARGKSRCFSTMEEIGLRNNSQAIVPNWLRKLLIIAAHAAVDELQRQCIGRRVLDGIEARAAAGFDVGRNVVDVQDAIGRCFRQVDRAAKDFLVRLRCADFEAQNRDAKRGEQNLKATIGYMPPMGRASVRKDAQRNLRIFQMGQQRQDRCVEAEDIGVRSQECFEIGLGAGGLGIRLMKLLVADFATFAFPEEAVIAGQQFRHSIFRNAG